MSIHTSTLRGVFLKWSDDGSIGGSDIWRSLARLSVSCISGHTTEQKAVAYSLYSVCSVLYIQNDETAILATTSAELVRKVHGPIAAAISFLDGQSHKESSAITIISDLADLKIGLVW